MIVTKIQKLEKARFYHITLNLRQILSKVGQKSYKNFIKDCFFPVKKKKTEHDEISKDHFFRYKN